MKYTTILFLLLAQLIFAQNPNNITISNGAQHLSTNNSSMHLIVGEPVIYKAPSTHTPSIQVGFHNTIEAASVASSTDLTFFTDDTIVQTGATIDYALRIKNVQAPIGAFTIYIAYDDTQLNYLTNVQAIPGMFIGHSTSGLLAINYVDPSPTGNGQQWGDSTALVLLRFYVNMNNGACTSLSLSNSVSAGVYDNTFASVNYTSSFDSICAVNQVVVEGMVRTEIGTAMPCVVAAPSLTTMLTDTTDLSGNYRIEGISNTTFDVTPNRVQDINYTNGIDIIDLLLIRRHILSGGINSPLSSPYKRIAANVSRAYQPQDVVINALDMFIIQQIINRQRSDFNGQLYAFIPNDYIFPNPNNPFPYPTDRQYTNLTVDQANEDYIGVKLGDVNNTWDRNSTLKSGTNRGVAVLNFDSCMLLEQGSGFITLYAGQIDSTVGIQGTIVATDSTVIEIDSAWAVYNPNFSFTVSAINATTLTFSSYSNSGYADLLPVGTPLIRMQISAIGGAGETSVIDVNSSRTPLYVYDGDFNPMNVQVGTGLAEITHLLRQEPIVENTPSSTLFPNPTDQSAVLQFSVPTNTTSIQLFNVLGILIWKKELPIGTTTTVIPLETLPAGNYLLKIQDIETSQIIETIKIEKI